MGTTVCVVHGHVLLYGDVYECDQSEELAIKGYLLVFELNVRIKIPSHFFCLFLSFVFSN